MASAARSTFQLLSIITGGAFLGAALTGILFSFQEQAGRSYIARLEFRGIVQDDMPGKQAMIDSKMTLAESLVHSRNFLQQVVNAPEFHRRADGLQGDAVWTRKHKGDEIAALQQDLQFVRHPTVNGFELSMRGSAAAEVTTLLTGAGRVLQERLDAASDEDAKERLKTLQKARSAAEMAFQLDRENLAAWSKANNIDVMRTRYEVERSALQQFTEESIRATALSVLSGAHLNTVKSLLKDFIDSSPSPKLNADKIKGVDAESVMKLSPEIEQQIDNDQTLEWLGSQRAQWEQERAEDLAKTTDGGRKVKEIDDRLKAIDQQKREEQNRLRWEAAERMLAQAEDDANSRTALLRTADLRKTETNNLVLSIGERVMEYQKRADDLKAKEELLKRVQMEYLKLSANPRSAVAQVETGALSPPIAETAAVEPSFPYIPVALAFGVGLVLLAAGLKTRNAPATR